MKDRPHIRRILRIMEMEQIFCTLIELYNQGALCPKDDPSQAMLLATLCRYYESPLWRMDYEADERGELPPTLKRGVLSQDGLYDFFTDIQPLLGENKDTYDR